MKKIFFSIILAIIQSSAAEIANYSLNGNAINSINNNLNGVIVGSVLPTYNRNDEENSALLFNGNGYIRVPEFKNLDFGNELTVSFWMRRDYSSNYQGIIGNGYYTHNSFEIRMGRESGGTFLFSRARTTTEDIMISNKNVIEIGKWHNVVLVVSKDFMKFYIDGNLVNNKNKKNSNFRILNNELIIGANGSTSERFYGALDDIRIFTNGLSENEINDLYTNTYDKQNLSVEVYSDNIRKGDSQQIMVNFENKTNESLKFHQWATLTLPTSYILSHRLAEEIVFSANSQNSFNKIINIQSWYPVGKYQYNYYLMDESFKIIKKTVNFNVE